MRNAIPVKYRDRNWKMYEYQAIDSFHVFVEVF